MNTNHDYWTEELIRWENRRYGFWSLFNPFSIPLKRRMKFALEILNSLSLDLDQKINIIELGCGSGLLGEKIRNIDVAYSYQGLDISPRGIELAQQRDLGPHFSFEVCDITKLDQTLSSDITILLGVSDWLSDKENRALLRKLSSPYLIWSYTLKNDHDLESSFYSFFRGFRDGKKKKALSFTKKEINSLFSTSGYERMRDDIKFSFGPGHLCCLRRSTEC